MVSCPSRSISTEKKPLCSCLPSWDSVPTIDQVFHPTQTIEPALHSVDTFRSLDMCLIWDGILPSDEVFLKSLIQYDLLVDVGSVVTKYNHDLLDNIDISID